MELGIWSVIIVTIEESSAAVTPIEKDGNHSLPLLFAFYPNMTIAFLDFIL